MSKKFVSVLLIVLLSACSGVAKRQDNTKKQSTSYALKMENVDLNAKDLQEQWEKEPMYGKKLKVSFEGALCTSGLGIAQRKGFMSKEGLEGEVINIPNPFDAIGTGKVEAITYHISAALVPCLNDLDMVFVRGAQTGCRSLYVLSDSGINSTKDFENKQIAISGGGIGGHDHNIALRFLFRDKVDWKSVKFKAIDTSATIQAMKNNEVQGAILSDQFAKKFIDKGELKVIRSITFDVDFKDEPCCVLILNKTFVEKNPITAAKLVKSHKEASCWIEDNKHDAAELLKANSWGSGDVESDFKFLQTYNFKVSDEQMEKTLIDSINDYKEVGIIDKNIETDKALSKIWRPVKFKK